MTQHKKDAEILACPFCGGEAIVGRISSNNFSVHCGDSQGNCPTRINCVTFRTEEAAINRWNTRHNPASKGNSGLDRALNLINDLIVWSEEYATKDEYLKIVIDVAKEFKKTTLQQSPIANHIVQPDILSHIDEAKQRAFSATYRLEGDATIKDKAVDCEGCEAPALYEMNCSLNKELEIIVENWLPYLKELRNSMPDKIGEISCYRKLKISEEIRSAEARFSIQKPLQKEHSSKVCEGAGND